MNSQKGITLTSVVIYVIVMAMIVGVIATITSFFYSNTAQMSDSATNLGEFNKFNAAFLAEIKKTGNQIYKIENESQRIIFSSGTVFTYQDGGIYQNRIKICEGVTDCRFSTKKQEEKQIVSVFIQIGKNAEFAKTIEYVMEYNAISSSENLEEDYSVASGRQYVQNGLLLHYDVINNTGEGHSNTTTTWRDLSPNHYDATLNNFDSTANSWKNKEIVLDGTDDWISTPLKQSELGNSFTITAVCRADDISNYRGLWGAHAHDGYTGDYFGTLFQFQDGNIYAGFTNEGCVIVPASNYKNKTIAITCVLENLKSVKLYIGNQLIGENIPTNAFIPNGNVEIGRSLPNDDRYWLGSISKFMIYNRALTEEEITQNYEIDKVRYGV